ncbi:hypothetical protein AURDEDRAFT_171992 [Auricularia subglabra TFB-10046 SS5]|nr:hypothetical protein AURDEDRAFT_171992 [Auricularia subglabra TFB-10046 SS5]
MSRAIVALFAFAAYVAAQVSPGIYRIGSVDFAQILASQSGSSIVGLGGNGDLGQTWYLAPASNGGVTIQNVKSLQYMSINGTPGNETAVVPSDAPFSWTLAHNGIAANDFYLTSFIGPVANLVLTTGPPELRNQQWTIGSITPSPSTYRLWNTATDTYLTAPASLPGALSALPSDATNALQLWTLAGTGPGSLLGTVANVETNGYISILNGTVGTFSAAQQFDYRWLFTNLGGPERLGSFSAPSPNVLAIGSDGQVTLDNANSGSQIAFVFVPASTSVAS